MYINLSEYPTMSLPMMMIKINKEKFTFEKWWIVSCLFIGRWACLRLNYRFSACMQVASIRYLHLINRAASVNINNWYFMYKWITNVCLVADPYVWIYLNKNRNVFECKRTIINNNDGVPKKWRSNERQSILLANFCSSA